MPSKDELVLVVPENRVFEAGHFIGVTTDPEKVGCVLKNAGIYREFKPHGSLEGNSELKQLIPYVVVRRNHDYFAYVRLEGGGESRLSGKLSIGIGGHMNDIKIHDEAAQREHSVSFTTLLQKNTERELEEELAYTFNMKDCVTTRIGIINDEKDAVGSEHIGILILIQIPPNADVSVREVESLEGRWMKLDEINNYDGPIEPWTKLALDHLI